MSNVGYTVPQLLRGSENISIAEMLREEWPAFQAQRSRNQLGREQVPKVRGLEQIRTSTREYETYDGLSDI